jgi:hypothetical protein
MQSNGLACSLSGLHQRITSAASGKLLSRDLDGAVLVAPGGAAEIIHKAEQSHD